MVFSGSGRHAVHDTPARGNDGYGRGPPNTDPVSVSNSSESSGTPQTPIWVTQGQGLPLSPKLAGWWAETQAAFAAGGHVARGRVNSAGHASFHYAQTPDQARLIFPALFSLRPSLRFSALVVCFLWC